MSYGNLCCLQFLPFSFKALGKVKIQVSLDFITPITPHCSINAMSSYPPLFSHKNYKSIQQLVFTHFFLFTSLLFSLLRLRVLGSATCSSVCHYTVRKIMAVSCIDGQICMFTGDPRGWSWQPGLQGGYCITQHKLLHHSPWRHSRVLLYWQHESLAALCPFVYRNKSWQKHTSKSWYFFKVPIFIVLHSSSPF